MHLKQINFVILIYESRWHKTNRISIQIHSEIYRENFDNIFIFQNIYNVKIKLKYKRLNKYTFTQILFKILNRDNWFVRTFLNENIKRMRRLFFVNKHMKFFFLKNFEIIMIDCTYKINKYKMFLMILIKHIALNIFLYRFCFFRKKKKKLKWILKHVKKLYAQLNFKNSNVIIIDRNFALINIAKCFFNVVVLLCIWYINKNVLIHCKFYFEIQKNWIFFLHN